MNVNLQDSDSITRALEDSTNLLLKLFQGVVEGGLPLTPKQWRLIADVRTTTANLRNAHILSCAEAGNKSVSELAEWWNMRYNEVAQLVESLAPQPVRQKPRKRVVYLGAIVTIPHGMHYLAFNNERKVFAFSIEPMTVGEFWTSRGNSTEVAQLLNVDAEHWRSSMRAVADLQEVTRD